MKSTRGKDKNEKYATLPNEKFIHSKLPDI
jgi:hypothetical protein